MSTQKCGRLVQNDAKKKEEEKKKKKKKKKAFRSMDEMQILPYGWKEKRCDRGLKFSEKYPEEI